MVKRIGRRFVSLLLTFVTVLTMLPAMTLPALAATRGDVTGLADQSIGLSFDGTADDAWSASSTTITGSVVSVGGTCSDTSYNSTLTIKNNKATKATLSFAYAIEQNSGTINVAGDSVTTNGSFKRELAAGGSINVYIKSGSTTATKITMTNVALVSDVTATATFVPAENGTYKVNGKLITEKYSNMQSSTTPYQVVATPAEGYQFLGWYNLTTGKCIATAATTALNIESDCTITAKFASKTAALFETGGQPFDDLNEAVVYARANNQNKITLASDGKITGNYTIPSGVTLLIPFDEAGTLYTNAPAAIRTTPASKAFRTLTMSEGTSITVNGAISLGGRYFAAAGGGQGRSVGDYGYIKMADNSSITVKNGGNLYAWGFISGSGSVLAESGATVYEFYQIADFRGGSASSNMGNKVFPFSQYFVQNIEVPLTLNAGAKEQVYSGFYAMKTTYTTTIKFIGDDGMFKVESGSFTKDYDEKTDRLVFTVNGEAALNTLSLKLAGMSVNSASYVLPITNNITINIQSGNVTINQDAALLAGVQVNIAEGAGLTVADGKNIYFYDSDEWSSDNFVWGPCKFKSVAYAPGKAYNRTNKDLVDAKMDVNGSVTAIGAIYTTKGGADICSSNKTGKYVQQGKPGAETETYQYNTNGNNKVTIPITAAQLHNADGSYTKTANAITGKTIPYCTCPTCGGSDGGKWLKDFAAIIDSTGKHMEDYPTLQKAVDAYNKLNDSTASKTYIQMLHSTTGDSTTGNVNTDKNLYLDLNGCTVKGNISVTGTYKLYGMDSSAKADYTTAPTGKIVGTVTGTVAPTYQTPTVNEEYDRYVAIPGTEADGNTPNLSFHHFNISVTGYRFELATGDTPQCALFFIGKFQGDAEAKKHLTSLGITLKGEDGRPLGTDSSPIPANPKDIPDMPADGKESTSEVVRSGDAYLFEVYLKRSFDRNSTDKTAYTEKIIATAQAMFKNNGTQDSEPKKWSFKDAWTETDGLKDLTTKQQEILNKFLTDLGINQQTE